MEPTCAQNILNTSEACFIGLILTLDNVFVLQLRFCLVWVQA